MYLEPSKGQALNYVFLYKSSCDNLINSPVNISLSFDKQGSQASKKLNQVIKVTLLEARNPGMNICMSLI